MEGIPSGWHDDCWEEGVMMHNTPFEDLLTDDGCGRAKDLYQDALDCVARAQLPRAQRKLRLALLYDPGFSDARRELDRLTL